MAIVDVVKYDGNPDTFVWKYPNQELGTWTQLIVNESQEAILVKGGQFTDVFGPGRHTLSTDNIPFLNKIINIPFGGKSPFTAEVWYINKVTNLDVKWGTSSPIQIQDPKYNIFIPVRSYGQFGIFIENSGVFLKKLVGTLPEFRTDDIVRYIKGIYLTKIKDAISSYVINKKITVLEINAYLSEISSFVKDEMQESLSEYGIRLVNFYVNDISVPEDDSAVKQLKSALAKKAEMDIVGYNYAQERSFDALEGAANNAGTGGDLMGAGLGLGMGVNLGTAFGNQMGGVSQNLNTNSATKKCIKCNSDFDEKAKFCPECGTPTVIKCSKCGFEVGSAKFCPECGEKVGV